MQIPVLGQLLRALGTSPLRLITAPAGLDTPVSGVLIYEPRATLPPARHALLLAVGMRPASAAARELVSQAAQAGHAGLAVKGYGEPVTELAAAANEAGIALLATEDDVAWHHLDALISSALTAAVQNRFGVLDQADAALVDECAAAGIAFMPFFALGGGHAPVAGEGLEQVARRRGATVFQVAIAWGLARSPAIVQIPGTSSLAHLEENMAAADLALDAADLIQLSAP